MCGIAGIIQANVVIDEQTASAVLQSLKHRGPDEQKAITLPDATLFHTRLSITDLSKNGSQPFTNDNVLYIVFNGEIYNYKELRNELIKEYKFISGTDTEVLLNAYKKWGTSCLLKLDGMFSFVIYNTQQRTFFGAVDKLGKKPMYYTHSTEQFVFSSDVKAIQLLTNRHQKLCIAGVSQFLSFGYTLAPQTIYKNIHYLEAGYCIHGSLSEGFTKRPYFELKSLFQTTNKDDYQTSLTHLQCLIKKAVTKRSHSDVEVGVLLSGGVDSAIVAALAHKYENVSKAFTIGFENKNYDELQAAIETANTIGLEHKYFRLKQFSRNDIYATIQKMQHPLGDNSFIALNELAKLASQDVKVVLSGDGGDELFAGYTTLKADYINDKWFSFLNTLKKTGLHSSTKNDGVGWRTKINRLMNGADKDYRVAHCKWREIFTQTEIIEIVGKEYEEEIRASDPIKKILPLYEDVKHLPQLKQHLYVDMKTWLHNDILVKIDRGGMSYGVEIRSPFLDDDVVAYCCSLPIGYQFKLFKNKSLLMDTFSDELGNLIRDKRKKGFNVPIGNWLNIKEDEFKFYTTLVFEQFRSKLYD